MEMLQVCRICLSSSPEKDISLLKSYKNDNKSPYELFAFCVDIQVTEESTLPTKLCIKCFTKIIEYYSFKSLALKNNDYLQSLTLNLEVDIGSPITENHEKSDNKKNLNQKRLPLKNEHRKKEFNFVDIINGTTYESQNTLPNLAIKTETDQDALDDHESESQFDIDVLDDDFVDVLNTSDHEGGNNTTLQLGVQNFDEESDDTDDEVDVLALNNRKRPRKQDLSHLKKKPKRNEKQESSQTHPNLHSYLSCKTTREIQNYFFEYIDDSIIDLILEKSNQNAEKCGKCLNITKEEFKAFIGITMLMECISYPRIRMYWSQKYAVPVIIRSMTRNRYILLRNSIKFINDDEVMQEVKENDNLWEVRPILDNIQKQDDNMFKEVFLPFVNECITKKQWPIIFISHLIDVSINKAWHKYQEEQTVQSTQKSLNFLTFKLAIAEKVLEDYLYPNNCSQIQEEDKYIKDFKKGKGRPSKTPMPSGALRQYGSVHMPEIGQSQHRCRSKRCRLKTTVCCSACGIYLCLTRNRNCFKNFHK